MAATEFELGVGETLILDVSLMDTPFSWSAEGANAAARCEYTFSLGPSADGWLDPSSNKQVVPPLSDAEHVPFTFMRFRHTAGGAVTIRVAGRGRVFAR